MARQMNFDRFDICEAYYVYAILNHQGQFSRAYRIFGRLDKIQFKPRPSLWGWENLGDNAQAIYDKLVANNY